MRALARRVGGRPRVRAAAALLGVVLLGAGALGAALVQEETDRGAPSPRPGAAPSGDHVALRQKAVPRGGLYEVFPELSEVVEPDDPTLTGRRLAERGFEVEWLLIVRNPAAEEPREDPEIGDPPGQPVTLAHRVAAPPPGTRVLSILNPRGEPRFVKGSRRLSIEITPRDSTGVEGEHPEP
jgi:hypothetical protein